MRLLRVGLAGLALVLILASPAWAHATLDSSDPADGSHMPTAPNHVSLQFSEAVRGASDALRVFDSEGRRVDEGVTNFAGSGVTVRLRSGLGDDGYIVAYRVISADSHPISGAITFVVGDGPSPSKAAVASVFDESADRPYEIWAAFMRWIGFGGALAALGVGVLFARTSPTGVVAQRLSRTVLVAATFGLLGAALEFLPRAALATGKGAGSLFESGVLSRLLQDGVGPGFALLAVGLAALVAGVALTQSETTRAATVGGALLVALSFVPAGHPTTTSPRLLALGGDLVHVAAAGVWFGGLVGLALAWRPLRATGGLEAATQMAYQFSRTATGLLVALWLAGGALAWTEVRTFDGLFHTTYGRVLLVKVALVAIVVFFGALNHYRLVPAIRTGDADDEQREWSWRLLGQSVRTEAGLLVGVVGLSAVLVAITPAHTSAGGGLQIFRAALGSGSVEVIVDPAERGRNVVHVSLFDAQGELADLAPQGLTLTFALPSAGVGGIEREPRRLGTGHYLLITDDLTVAGDWTVKVTALRTEFDELTAEGVAKIR
jgi:copper transport protein